MKKNVLKAVSLFCFIAGLLVSMSEGPWFPVANAIGAFVCATAGVILTAMEEKRIFRDYESRFSIRKARGTEG